MLPATTQPTSLDTVSPALSQAQELIQAFLSGRSPRTIEAYKHDLMDFARYLGAPDINSAAKLLLTKQQGDANHIVLRYRNEMLDRQLSPATVNRRLAAIRSLVGLAQTLGMVNWTLSVRGVRSQAYRDTTGPGAGGFKLLLKALEGRDGPKSARDRAIVRLLHDVALRRGEVVGLDVTDVDLERGVAHVLGKGKLQRQTITLPEPTKEAVAKWLEVAGWPLEGPLFTNFDRAAKGRRLTGRSVNRVLGRLGEKVGIEVRPHGLRHAGITRALDVTHGDVRAVQKFSRHADVRTLMVYDDNRTDLGGQVASLVAAAG